MSAEETLAAVEILSDFPRDFLKRVAEASVTQAYAPGEVIVREDEAASAFYVVTAGTVEAVRAAGTAQEQVVARLGPGSFFGEMAILREGSRTATVRATGDAHCLMLRKTDFEAELRRDPNAAAVLAPRLARRLRVIRKEP